MPLDLCPGFLAACLPGTKRTPALSELFLEPKAPPPPLNQEVVAKGKLCNPASSCGVLELLPLFWSYLPSAERLALRLSCREGRRIHDALVTNLYVCDSLQGLAALPAARLPACPLPVCRDTAAELSGTLRGLVSRGCRPSSLLLCFGASERKRLEQSLAALMPLAEAPLELSSLHLAGVPLTPQLARALQPLLTPPTLPLPRPPCPALSATPAGASAPLDAASASLGPPPLHLFLYGYDLSRSPAAAVLDSVVGAAAPRLHRLELWGCPGWPPRLTASLQACSRLQHLCLSFQSLLANASASGAANAGSGAHAPQPAGGGALANYTHLPAALSAAAAIRTLGTLRHLHSLELRGVAFRPTPPASNAAARNRRRGGGAKPGEASPENAAEVAGLTPQLLSCALFQLTALTSLSVEGLRNPAPLMSALAAMRGLRRLELPDALAPPTTMEAIVRSAPRLTELTLGSVGHAPVLLLTDTDERAAASARRAPEPMPLPPALAALRVAQCRPTLRALRALRRALEARAAAPAGGAEATCSGGGGSGDGPNSGNAAGLVRDGGAAVGSAALGMALVVPGIELDLPDVDFDPLQAFHRSEDGVMRSVLLPESAQALAAAIAMLAPPLAAAAPGAARAGGSSAAKDGGGLVASSNSAAGREGSPGDGACCGDPRVGDPWRQRELVIHNDYGSLAAAASASGLGADDDDEQGQHHSLHPSKQHPPWLGAVPRSVTAPAAGSPGGVDAAATAATAGQGAPVASSISTPAATAATRPGRAGHAVWLCAMAPLRLTALELYGIGLRRVDLAAVAELTTLRRLTLAAAELSTEALPALAALPDLEELELLRCMPRRRVPHIGRFSFSPGGASAAGASAAGAGGAFARVSGSSTPSRRGGCAAASVASGASGNGGAGSPEGVDAGEVVADFGQRALLELCLAAPRLRRLHVVRAAGTGAGAGGVDGPLGAEWVRRQLATLEPRRRRLSGADGDGGKIGTCDVGRRGVEAESVAWPEVVWD